MLVTVDLMSIVGAASPAAKTRGAGDSDAGALGSWLLAADASSASSDGKDMINKLFMSYASDGKADPEGRFAADLRALLSAHGVSLPPEQSLLSLPSGAAVPELDGALGEQLGWSVDELLQMSPGALASGNSLPLDDQSLPSALSNWLAALSMPAGESPAGVAEGLTPANSSVAQLLGGSGTPGQPGKPGGALTPAGGPIVESTALGGALVQGAALSALSPPVGGAPVPGMMAAAKGDSVAALATDVSMNAPDPDAEHDALMLRSPVPADTNRQTSETALASLPGSQKVASEVANVSAFRSIQFNQSGSATDDGQPMSADILKTSAPLERNQAIASQLSASLLSGISAENPASPNAVSGQAANAALNAATADDGTLFNRADQRMFATENAQQAQSQAAQQSATRTADGLPRFTMDTAFGQQGWSDSLGRQLLVMSSQGITSAQIRLDPPELGSLTVKIQMSADQQTNVSFVSQHATVREALEQQLSRLQDLFRDQGLNLQDVSVSDQSPQQREDEANGQQNQGTGSGSESGEQETSASEPVLVRSESLIDFYA